MAPHFSLDCLMLQGYIGAQIEPYVLLYSKNLAFLKIQFHFHAMAFLKVIFNFQKCSILFIKKTITQDRN